MNQQLKLIALTLILFAFQCEDPTVLAVMLETNLIVEPAELKVKDDSIEFFVTIEYPYVRKAKKLDSIVHEFSYAESSTSWNNRNFTILSTKCVMPIQNKDDSIRIDEFIKSKVELKKSYGLLYIRTLIFKNGESTISDRMAIARIEKKVQ